MLSLHIQGQPFFCVTMYVLEDGGNAILWTESRASQNTWK